MGDQSLLREVDMSLFSNLFSAHRTEKKNYDKERLVPVLRASICTGERTAGFRDVNTGKYEQMILIRTDDELREFMESYGIDKITKEY